jgi:hypothetical protein
MSNIQNIWTMKKKILHLVFETFLFVLIITMTLSGNQVNGQQNNNLGNNDPVKIDYKSAGSKDTNFQEAANMSNKQKRAEALPPPDNANKESHQDSIFTKGFLDSAKNLVKKSESLANFGKVISVDPRNIEGLGSTTNTTNTTTAAMTVPSTTNTTNTTTAAMTVPSTTNTTTAAMTVPSTTNTTNTTTAAMTVPSTTHAKITSWKGLSVANANVNPKSRVHPPDVAMAAGPNHVVQIVHHGIQIWDKSGNEKGFSFLNNFFKTAPGHFIGDQDIFYDNSSGHWFATIFDLGLSFQNEPTCKPGGCSILAAVSAGKDPTGNWSIYSFPFGHQIPDYPHISVSDDKFVFTVNDFPVVGDGYYGVQMLVADKNSMIDNQGKNVSYGVTPTDKQFFTVLPVRSNGSDKCLYLLSTDARIPSDHPVYTKLNLFNVCGNPSSKDVKINNVKDIEISSAPIPVSALQPSTERRIDTGDGRMQTAVSQDGIIVNAFNTACVPAGDVNQACVRVQMINTSDYSLSEDASVGIKGHDMFHPSLAVNNKGGMIIIAAVSGSNSNLALVAGNKNYDFKTLVQGSAPLDDSPTDDITEANRYGDYLSASIDPTDGTFWVSGEYVDHSLPERWSTIISHIPNL